MGGQRNKIHPVILCGGTGTRLWPLSRTMFPKQFIPFLNENSLIQDSAKRFSDTECFREPLIVASYEHRFIVAEQLRAIGLDSARILLEPARRNTAPAIAAAAAYVARQDPDAVLAVLPADHAIPASSELRTALMRAARLTEHGYLMTLGIAPTGPECGFGYLKPGSRLAADSEAFHVEKFVEKPDRETAAKMIDEDHYLWNSGIFVMNAKDCLDEIALHAPAVHKASCRSLASLKEDSLFISIPQDTFSQAPDISFDCAVMEKTEHVAVVPASFHWSDVGTWHSLWEIAEKDPAGNAVQGPAHLVDVSRSYFRTDDSHLLVAVGVDDLVVVTTRDATLVAARDRASEVGGIVKTIDDQNAPQISEPVRMVRPWGFYEVLSHGDGFRVKRLVVDPGGQTSLQYHRFRSEYWTVISGCAEIVKGSSVISLSKGESIQVAERVHHKISNNGNVSLEMIEVQCGSYVGEDDIVRVDDVYGRAEPA